MAAEATESAFDVQPFIPAADDPLAAEHELVAHWVEAVWEPLDEQVRSPLDVNFARLPGGEFVTDARPAEARRIVLAALAQARHWHAEVARFRERFPLESQRLSPALRPAWGGLWSRRRLACAFIFALMQRPLPLESADLVALIRWALEREGRTLNDYYAPVALIAKAAQRRVAAGVEVSGALREALREFATVLSQWPDKRISRFGPKLERLVAESVALSDEAPNGKFGPHPLPAPAGDPRVLDALKRTVGVAESAATPPATETLGPDRFLLRVDSPLAAEHRLLSDVYASYVGTPDYHNPRVMDSPFGPAIAAMDDAGRGRLLLAAAERAYAAETAPMDYSDATLWQSRGAAMPMVRKLAAMDPSLDRAGALDYLLSVAVCVTPNARFAHEKVIERCLAQVESIIAGGEALSDGERYVLHLLRSSLINGPLFNKPGAEVMRLNKLIGDGAQFFLVPGEAWTDALNADLRAISPKAQQAWIDLLKHLLTATSSRPSPKWIKMAGQLVGAIGKTELVASVERWLPLVSEGQTVKRTGAYVGDIRGEADTIHEENANVLRGMLWIIPTLKEPERLARIVTGVALSAYKKVPGVGPRAVKVGNAAVYALSEMASADAVGQLAMLKVRVKFGTAQKEIEKAFNTAAAALGLPRDQIEEMGVPSYGLEEVGLRREIFANGEYAAELRVDGRDVEIHWSRADGKPQKSVPAKVKSEQKEELKELQTAAKDIAAMLPAQSERLDSMLLLRKQWEFPTWRERYLDHPLVGTLGRRLIWDFNGKSAIWHDGRLVDVDDQPIDVPADANVSLWHPIGRPLDDTLAWRGWLERQQARQPFKQAHREVYVLTDAERRTSTYSNRFAGHILRQHQFNALCAARGWKNKLRLMVDDTYPPATKELPTFGLRAEYWIEGIGDDYGTDTTESGAYLRLSTDQVRFYRTGAADNSAHAGGGGYTTNAAGPGEGDINQPVPLEQIPPLVLSEILRDVDLFVGVASVGNDPTWQDGGPGGRFQTYWQSYSFGDLTETAKTRKAVLEQLLPRLKIAAKCALSDKFLIVKGDLRTYKIHLGSGNILMEPNDQYLCIVPARGSAAPASEAVFLPFEGDGTLSVILSKAFLLAEDKKIKDDTIVRQIKGER